MNSPVIIKSFQNGIAVILDETLAFPQLSEEVGLKEESWMQKRKPSL